MQAVVVRGAAVVAATKVAELVARRIVRNLFRRNGKSERLPATSSDTEIVPGEEAIIREAVVRETFLTRTIHFRR